MSFRGYFSANYIEARRKFRDAATNAGARLRSIVNRSIQGPAEEELTTDLAWLGPAAASHVLVTISGTHGAEGFCGSGVQTGTFAGAPVELPAAAVLRYRRTCGQANGAKAVPLTQINCYWIARLRGR